MKEQVEVTGVHQTITVDVMQSLLDFSALGTLEVTSDCSGVTIMTLYTPTARFEATEGLEFDSDGALIASPIVLCILTMRKMVAEAKLMP